MTTDNKGNGGRPPEMPTPKKTRISLKWPKDDLLREIIFAYGGIVNEVAKRIGVDRRTVERKIHSRPKVKEWFYEAREHLLDLAESKVMQAIENGSAADRIFFLKCHGKDRGWVERSEVAGVAGKPLFDMMADARRVSDGIRAAIADESIRQRLLEVQALVEKHRPTPEETLPTPPATPPTVN